MDPDATLNDLIDAMQVRDWERVDELAETLLGWMENRGFPPTTIGPKKLGTDWHQAIATFVCYAAKSKARDAFRRRQRKGKS